MRLFTISLALGSFIASALGSAVVHTNTTLANAGSLHARAGTFTNPIKTTSGSDPFMTINGLKTAADKLVWSDTTPDRCCGVWAPEIHKLSGAWYIYYTAGPSDGTAQRVHVIKGSSASSIWDSTWSYAGRISPSNRNANSALDGTILNHSTGQYVVWSSWTDGVGQCLYISKLSGPASAGTCTIISRPTYDWEKIGAAVNEGPAFMYHGGRTFMTYSASLCSGTGYKLGLIELTGSDPLNPSSWTKNSTPVFTSANGNNQPGHNGFFTPPDGTIWNVYHAQQATPGQCDGSRYTNVQPVSWNSDGSPNLGSPDALSQAIPEPGSGSTGGTPTTSSPSSTPTSGGTVPQYGQCGGQGWTGGTICVSPFKCTYSNEFYSQCL